MALSLSVVIKNLHGYHLELQTPRQSSPYLDYHFLVVTRSGANKLSCRVHV
jgi:hypothetical protein